MKNTVLIVKELGATPSVAEMEVVDILVLNTIPKKSVKFLKPNRAKGSKTPDLQIDGLLGDQKYREIGQIYARTRVEGWVKTS